VVASGFTLIFGLLRIVNLAHGALYLFGGYVGYTVGTHTGSFALAAVAAMASVALIGTHSRPGTSAVCARLRASPGAADARRRLRAERLALVIWGGDTFTVPTPVLQGAIVSSACSIRSTASSCSSSACSSSFGLWLLLNRTGSAPLIRAGVDDAEMVEASGINIRRVFLLTFMLGSALSGLGGLLGGAFLTLYPSADSEILVFSLAVVIIGGRGSLEGAAIGSLFIGLFNTFGQVWFPELAYFVIFGPMALLLAFRPLGLFGRAA
jgi:branched-chain amino acid transport system permease protein